MWRLVDVAGTASGEETMQQNVERLQKSDKNLIPASSCDYLTPHTTNERVLALLKCHCAINRLFTFSISKTMIVSCVFHTCAIEPA